MTFEELWELEERQGVEHRLKRDFPQWKHRRSMRRTIVASVAIVMVVAHFVFVPSFAEQRNYDYVCCNRSTFPENHWVDVASNILTKETL